MTGHSIDILGPHDPALGVDCIEARTMLAERFSNFATISKAGMSDTVARELRTWLDAPAFALICTTAEVDSRILRAVYERQIYLGQNHGRETTATIIPFPKQE